MTIYLSLILFFDDILGILETKLDKDPPLRIFGGDSFLLGSFVGDFTFCSTGAIFCFVSMV